MRKELKELGLTEKETDLYVSGLRLGPATIQQLSKTSNFKRSTVYFLIERLKKLGLVSKSFKKKKKLFEMAPPEKFLRIFEDEKQKMTEKERNIQKIVSSLKDMASKKEFASDIKMFEGYDEVAKAITDLAKTEKPMYSIYSGHYFDKKDYKKIKKSIAEINKIRKSYNAKSYIITDSETMIFRFYSEAEKDPFIEYLFLPQGVKLPSMIDICSDKIILSSVQKESCILIQNKTIAEMMKFMFNMIWQSLGNKNLPIKKQTEQAISVYK